MKIQAAVATNEGFKIGEFDLEEPRDDEILVKVVGVGLCHTDLVFSASGTLELPAVLGHEGSGVVEKVGASVNKVKPGDKVVMSFASCGECDRCHSGDPAYCRSMPLLNFAGCRQDGSKAISNESGVVGSHFFGQSSFANYALTSERNVVPVPDAVPLELMGPLGCGIQTGAGAVMRSLEARADASILIVGGGSVGLSAVMGAKVQGCEPIILAEPVEARRVLATELGATHVIDPTGGELNESVREIEPQGVDYALDTTGIPTVLENMVACLGTKAVMGMVGITPPETRPPGDLMALVTIGATLRGIIEGDSDPDEFIPQLIELYQDDKFPFDKLIKTYPLADIEKAIAEQHEGVCIKAVLLP